MFKIGTGITDENFQPVKDGKDRPQRIRKPVAKKEEIVKTVVIDEVKSVPKSKQSANRSTRKPGLRTRMDAEAQSDSKKPTEAEDTKEKSEEPDQTILEAAVVLAGKIIADAASVACDIQSIDFRGMNKPTSVIFGVEQAIKHAFKETNMDGIMEVPVMNMSNVEQYSQDNPVIDASGFFIAFKRVGGTPVGDIAEKICSLADSVLTLVNIFDSLESRCVPGSRPPRKQTCDERYAVYKLGYYDTIGNLMLRLIQKTQNPTGHIREGMLYRSAFYIKDDVSEDLYSHSLIAERGRLIISSRTLKDNHGSVPNLIFADCIPDPGAASKNDPSVYLCFDSVSSIYESAIARIRASEDNPFVPKGIAECFDRAVTWTGFCTSSAHRHNVVVQAVAVMLYACGWNKVVRNGNSLLATMNF